MKYIINCLIVTVVVNCIHFNEGISPPGAPINVQVVSDVNNIGVQWEPPSEQYGNILSYIVSWSILPNFTEVKNIVSSDVTMCIIPVQGHIGRLFRIRVQAENEGGIGPYSKPSYVRIACGTDYGILPGRNVTVTSPGFESRGILPPGVLCSWSFHTLAKYSLRFFFNFIQLEASDTQQCVDTYLDITEVGKLCNLNNSPVSNRRTGTFLANMTLKTGITDLGIGFNISVKSVVLLPDPPSDILIDTSDHAVLVAWKPPRGETLAITAYKIRYRVQPNSGITEVTIGPKRSQFAINTDQFEGKLIALNMTSVIGEEEGAPSKTMFIRAPCRRRIHLNGTNSVNITSPGYPHAYPSNIICTWYFTQDINLTSSITYIDFHLEDTTFCSSDYISFSFLDNVEHECSDLDAKKTLQTDVTNFTLTFVSDGVNEYRGFLIQVTSSGTSQFPSTFIRTQAAISTTEIPTQNLKSSTSTDAVVSISSPTLEVLYTRTTSVSDTTISSKQDTLPNSLLTGDYNPTTSKYRFPSTKNFATGNTNPVTVVNTAVTKSPYQFSSSSTENQLEYFATPNSRSVPNAYQGDDQRETPSSSTASTTTTETITDEILTHSVKFTIIVVSSIVAFLFLFCVTVCYFRWRHKHKSMKINDKPERFTSIEMHDILNNQSRTYRRNPASLYLRQSSRSPKLETIHEHPEEECIKPEVARLRRQRFHSFPFCFSARSRKIHTSIERTLKTLDFIEDQNSLRETLERKHRVRRNNSF